MQTYITTIETIFKTIGTIFKTIEKNQNNWNNFKTI